jgi:hypothetical protein
MQTDKSPATSFQMKNRLNIFFAVADAVDKLVIGLFDVLEISSVAKSIVLLAAIARAYFFQLQFTQLYLVKENRGGKSLI